MLYPKNIVTYSAYVKNMESFVKTTLGLKKDVKLANREKKDIMTIQENSRKTTGNDKKNLKGSETISSSTKNINIKQSKNSNLV